LYVTYINIILYALCYQLQRPVEPFLVQRLSSKQYSGGSSHTSENVTRTYGQLQSFFSFIQTIGSPIIGVLLDRWGIKIASSIVFLSSALSYSMLMIASSDQYGTMSMLFYSKIPTAFQHAFLIAQAIAAMTCSNDDSIRATALGRMTTFYTIGATIGPALGGYLTQHSHGGMYIAATLAVIGSLISVILSIVFLPNHKNSQSKTMANISQTITNNSSKKGTNNSSSNTTTTNVEALKQRSWYDEAKYSLILGMRYNLWPLLVVKVMTGIASSMYQTTLPILLTQELQMDPSSLGLLMSSSMFAVAIFGAFGMSPLIQFYTTTGTTYFGLLVRNILIVCMAYTISNAIMEYDHDQPLKYHGLSYDQQIILVSILQSVASHILATGLTTQTTGIVSKQEQGALLGLEHGLFSLARIMGPPVGTNVLLFFQGGSNGFWAIVIVCGFIDIVMLLLLRYKELRRNTSSYSGKNLCD
jgi:MFS family permease